MTQILKTLFNTLEGKWISQKTIYDLMNKNMKMINSTMNISLINSNDPLINLMYICEYKNRNNKQITYNYIIECKTSPTIGQLTKTDNYIETNYAFKLQDKKNLKIQYVNKNLLYTEYIYFMHTNFKLSIVILKQNNKYMAICFISDIKIMKYK